MGQGGRDIVDIDKSGFPLMRTKTRVYVRFFRIYAVLAALGIAGAVYVLVHQRLTLPGQRVYTIKAEFSAADGVLGGIGQPVDVVGVQVGQVTHVALTNGAALVSMQIQRQRLPRVYANATAALQPVTPLGDMQIDLQPGGRPAPPLPDSSTITLAQTTAPVPLSGLLSRLDSDTRDYLTGVLASLQQGTQGEGVATRRMLLSLGPTTRQVGEITQALAGRRVALAGFVHNLAAVTRAAARDGQLASVVVGADRTLQSMAEQDRPLRQAIAELPGTLDLLQSTLQRATPFANELGPTLTALRPAIDRLPTTFRSLHRLAAVGTPTIKDDVAPLVSKVQPLLGEAAPAVANLTRATPTLTGAAQTLNYFLNEFAYVPGGSDQGFLFWADWLFHNLDTAMTTADANGSVLRAAVLADCSGLQAAPALVSTFSFLRVCPH